MPWCRGGQRCDAHTEMAMMADARNVPHAMTCHLRAVAPRATACPPACLQAFYAKHRKPEPLPVQQVPMRVRMEADKQKRVL